MKTLLPDKIVINTCECLRCQHLWPTRLQGRKPIICPRCRSIYWDTKAQHVPKAEQKRVAAVLAAQK